jgi:2-polyprenyl-3-methyl-5-hydroxy-6-metoxy-1,4-benzoquinol methylase
MKQPYRLFKKPGISRCYTFANRGKYKGYAAKTLPLSFCTQGRKSPMHTDPELLEKIRQQFDFAPYPTFDIEADPKDNYELLFKHSLVTPYYLKHQKVVDTQGKVILDAGCGSGYYVQTLALANPGAKVIGIDLSEKSIDLAQQRLEYHSINNVEFYALGIEDVPQLGLEFDYINCNEVLYLMPDIALALKTLKSVLKPTGIIRSNLHSSLQRSAHFRAQQLFKMMGLMDSNPEDLEIEIAVETMQALKDNVDIKRRAFDPKAYEGEGKKAAVLMNYLFQGDKGYTVPELFAALRQAALDFVSMVNWRQWEILDLFKDTDNLPAFWALSLPELSIEQRLHIFELLQPAHRLIDFWCSQPASSNEIAVSDWDDKTWRNAQITLHPILQTERVKNDLIKALTELHPFNLGAYGITPTTTMEIEVGIAACLLLLWEGKQPVTALVERYLKTRPLNLVTLEPVTEKVAFAQIQRFLTVLEGFLYVLLESSN